MATELVTGYGGSPHVGSADVGAFQAALCGAGDWVFVTGQAFACQAVSANVVRIRDGEAVMQGRHFRTQPDDYTDLSVANGQPGLKRNDLVVARYTRDGATGVETVALAVLQGTPGAEAADPAVTTGDVTAGALLHEMPLWRIPLDGLTVGAPVRLFSPVFGSLFLLCDGEDAALAAPAGLFAVAYDD